MSETPNEVPKTIRERAERALRECQIAACDKGATIVTVFDLQVAILESFALQVAKEAAQSARKEALEEAANVSDSMVSGGTYSDEQSYDQACREISKEIRALLPQGSEGDK